MNTTTPTTPDLAAAQKRLMQAYRWVCSYSAYYGEPTREMDEAQEEYTAAIEETANAAAAAGASEKTVQWIRECPWMAGRGQRIPLE